MEPKKPNASIFFKNTLLSSKRLRDELLVAFGLISVTLLVLLGYLFPGVSSLFESRHALPVVILIVLLIIVLGFVIILQIVEPVIKISREAKMIVKGDWDRQIQLSREDELGDLGLAVNEMTRRIRDSVDELKNLSRQTAELNGQINERITTLASLMEVSGRIAQNLPLIDVVELVVQKALQSQGMSWGGVILKDFKTNEFKMFHMQTFGLVNVPEGLAQLKINLGEGVLGKAILRQEVMAIDRNTPLSREVEDFRRLLGLQNAVIAPISSRGHAYGLIVIGDQKEGGLCTEARKELLQLLSKNVAVAVLNDLLTRQIQAMEETDALTGLFNNTYVHNQLDQEVKAAVQQQRTCSFVLLKLDRFPEYKEAQGHIEAENVLIHAASLIKGRISGNDRAARFSEDEFALILPGRSKKEALALAGDVVQALRERGPLTSTAAVVENPIDGASAEELILKSGVILADGFAQGGDRVEH